MKSDNIISRLEYSLVQSDWETFSTALEEFVKDSVSVSQAEKIPSMGLMQGLFRAFEGATLVGHLIEDPSHKTRLLSGIMGNFAFLLSCKSESAVSKSIATSFSRVCNKILENYVQWSLFTEENLGTWDACRFIFRATALCECNRSTAVTEFHGRAVSDLMRNSPQYLMDSIYFRAIFHDIMCVLLDKTSEPSAADLFANLIWIKTVRPYCSASPSSIENVLYIRSSIERYPAKTILKVIRAREQISVNDSLWNCMGCCLVSLAPGSIAPNAHLIKSLSETPETLSQAINLSFVDCKQTTSLFSPAFLPLIARTVSSFPEGYPLIESRRRNYIQVVGTLIFDLCENYPSETSRVLSESFKVSNSPKTRKTFLGVCACAFNLGLLEQKTLSAMRSTIDQINIVETLKTEETSDSIIDAVVGIFAKIKNPTHNFFYNCVFDAAIVNIEHTQVDTELIDSVFNLKTKNETVHGNQIRFLRTHFHKVDDFLRLGVPLSELLPKLIDAFGDDPEQIHSVLRGVRGVNTVNSDEIVLIVAKSQNYAWWKGLWHEGFLQNSLREISSIEELLRLKPDLVRAISLNQKLELLNHLHHFTRSRL